MIKNIFLDLDGTMLPMDMKKFMKLYFSSMTEAVCPYIEMSPETLQKALLGGMEAMYQNQGAMSNKMCFWNKVATMVGPEIINDIPMFNGYYENEFILTKEATTVNPYSRKIVDEVRRKGYNTVMATNPFFPKIATERRVKWAGLDKNDFSVITTYENSKYCKPNPKYFIETCEMAKCKPEETLMVGNDVREDMISATIGMETFLVTDDLINRDNVDISGYKQGSLKDFYEYCLQLPDLTEEQ